MEPIPFSQFDVVSDPSDHEYVSKTTFFRRTNGKKIMQEWKLLEKHLPEGSIYVRAYDTRVDLLRAVIVGAPLTPYHDGLFFFDIYFPNSYPDRPPLVKYRSFGHRINPNLYTNGTVCLSLLNTWSGSKPEKWNPNNSNVLQVLLSIQALVLNEKPFFNEPEYEAYLGETEMENKCYDYSANAYVLSCKSMLQLLRNPPKHFEVLVLGHFNRRAGFILESCDVYRNGLVKIGKYDGNNLRKYGERWNLSQTFKDTMDKLYGELLLAIERARKESEEAENKAKEAKEDANNAEEAEKKAIEREKKANNEVVKTSLLKRLNESVFQWISAIGGQETNTMPVTYPQT